MFSPNGMATRSSNWTLYSIRDHAATNGAWPAIQGRLAMTYACPVDADSRHLDVRFRRCIQITLDDFTGLAVAQHGFYARPSAHLPTFWQRAMALVQSFVVQASFASFRAVS